MTIMKIKDIYNKYQEQILYIIFGFFTTLISIAVFAFFSKVIFLDELIANILSFIAAVFFAFVTNRKWVFSYKKQESFLKQLLLFYLGRLFTLIIEEAILFVFVSYLHFDALIIKTVSQVVVIILNYIISKIFIFKKPQE